MTIKMTDIFAETVICTGTAGWVSDKGRREGAASVRILLGRKQGTVEGLSSSGTADRWS